MCYHTSCVIVTAELKASGVPAERIADLVKFERRKEENKESKERAKTCFSCRQEGHVVANCPLKQNTEGVGACFKVGLDSDSLLLQ